MTIRMFHTSLADDKEGGSEDESNKEEAKEVTSDKQLVTRGAQRIEHNSLVMQKVNCRSILN
jgi:hypothetical protein